jgi:hypothetical protein
MMDTRLILSVTKKVLVSVLVLSTASRGVYQAISPAVAVGPDVASLVTMTANGEGQAALLQVAETALALGGWGPAPGDEIVYDPAMSDQVRGSVKVIDLPPGACVDEKLRRLTEECGYDFETGEQQVRFGRSMFSNPTEDGGAVARPVFDDVLATYIEEVGHSWQEYLYETEGKGGGPRVRLTSWDDAHYWAHGREYQVKTYILNLDGTLLALSDGQREELRSAICNGYANPIGQRVPSYGPPPGWANPDAWPTAVPTPEAWQALCPG